MSEIKLKPTGGGAGSVSLKAPAATTGNEDVPFILPVADGSAGQYLKTDGSKNLSFATVSAGVTQWESSWAATTSGNEHTITGIPAAATHVRLIGEGMKIVDNADMRFQMGYGDASSNSWDSDGYRITRGWLGSDGQGTSGDTTDSIRTYGLTDLDYTRFHIIDWHKLNTSNLWAFRTTAHFYNNESSGSAGNTFFWIWGDVTLGGTFYKVKAYNNTFSAGAFKLQAWY